MAGPLPYESGWREVAPPAGGGFDAVQAAVKCGASACTELVVNGARNNAVFSLTLALSQGASTQAELVALAAGLLSRVGADLEPAPGEPQVPALPDAPTPEAAAAPVHDSFPTDWVLTLADAQAFAPGLSGFQVTGEARWTADAGWSGGGAVPAALNTAAARDPGILFATGPDEIGYVPVPSLGGAEISAQRASFHMIWDGAGGGPAMYLRLFIGAYAVPAADVTAAIRTGRPLTDGWAAAPVPLPPSVGAAMAIRCGSEDACNAMSVNYAAGNTVLAITASVPQGMSQEAILDLFGRFFSVLGTRVRTH